jgi:hypothetical protein
MELEEIRAKAAELFPLATRFAIANPGVANVAFEQLHQLCASNYSRLGFFCHADFFTEIVPKLEGTLSLDAWCRMKREVSGWPLEITVRPFYLGAGFVHFEFRSSDGPIPGLTGTGYLSDFRPLSLFAEHTVEEFLAARVPARAREQQLTLF